MKNTVERQNDRPVTLSITSSSLWPHRIRTNSPLIYFLISHDFVLTFFFRSLLLTISVLYVARAVKIRRKFFKTVAISDVLSSPKAVVGDSAILYLAHVWPKSQHSVGVTEGIRCPTSCVQDPLEMIAFDIRRLMSQVSDRYY